MIPDTYNKLITKLGERTSRGEVNWRATSEEKTFIVNFSKGFSLSMFIFYSMNEWTIRVTIFDSEGKEIDSFDVGESDDYYDIVREMHDSARRKALNIDKAIENIWEELESEGAIGEEGEK